MRHQLLLFFLILFANMGNRNQNSKKNLKFCKKGFCPFGRSGYGVGLHIGVDGRSDEEKDDDGGNDDADNLGAFEPLLVAPADGLEHAPETVLQVQEQGDESDDVAAHDHGAAEGGEEQEIGILGLCTHEFLQLHLGPEVGEVEAQETQDEDAQDGHVLGAPAVVLGLGGYLVALKAATIFNVLIAEPDTPYDVEEEAQGQDGYHNCDNRGGHEVAAQLEPTVSVSVGEGIGSNFAEVPVHGIDDGEEINGAVEEQEDDEESAGDALDELLADGGG